jgi:hypothetical protein
MIPQKQTRQHPNGDCTRACIASLLELPVENVPDWIDAPDATAETEGYPNWYYRMQQWLSRRGYAFVEIQLERKTWMPLPFPTAAIFIGPHESGARHAIVGHCEGGRFIPMHDPLGGPPYKAFLEGHVEAVCFLVPLDPGKQRYRTNTVSDALGAMGDVG